MNDMIMLALEPNQGHALALKKELWDLLADQWSIDLTTQTKTVNLDGLSVEVDKILNGGQIGRVIIEHGE